MATNTDVSLKSTTNRCNNRSIIASSEADSIRILHVDDDPSLVELTQSFLQRENETYDIDAETNPREAIGRIESELSEIDCIVSDYQMPRMDGLELLQVAREHDADIPFILFTGQGSEDIAAEAIAAGVTDYLQKGGAEAYSILSNRIENLVENYRRQQELDRIHDHYHTLIEDGSEIVCVHTADGSIQYINSAVERILGFTPDSLTGENLFEYIHPDDCDRVQQQFSALQSCDDTRKKTVQCRCRNAASEWQWIEASFSDKRISSLDAFVINARDVTPQVERKRELQRQNKLFEATQQLASVGGWEYDTRSETLHWTDEVRRIHGVPSGYEPTLEEAIEFYHPDDRNRVREAITSVIEQGEPFNFECRIGTASDEWRWIRARGEPRFEDGNVIRIQGAAVDITERRDREIELRDTSERLRRQNERLERFAGIVSHDLRNPLTIARTGLGLARKDDGCEHDCLERVDRAHDRMAALIEDLLTLARDGGAVSENDIEQLELSDIVTKTWGAVSSPEAELHVVEDGTISADGSRLRQLFENLFRNSTVHVGDDVTIRAGVLADGDGFYIEDDGPGIPEADREDVFDPGYTTQEDGTGFGLEIVRNIAHAHGWTVTLTESCDGGVRFEITTTDA